MTARKRLVKAKPQSKKRAAVKPRAVVTKSSPARSPHEVEVDEAQIVGPPPKPLAEFDVHGLSE